MIKCSYFKKSNLILFGLFFMFCLSFGFNINSVSALKYPITQIPLGPSTIEFRKMTDVSTGQDFYTIGGFSRNFEVFLPSGVTLSNSFRYPHTYSFNGNYDSDTNTCSIPFNPSFSYYNDGVNISTYSSGVTDYRYRNALYSLNVDSFNSTFFMSTDSPFEPTFSYYSQLSSSVYPQYIDKYGRSLCGLYNYAYSREPLNGFPGWDWSSLVNIPLVNDRFKYSDGEPFTYSYSTLELPSQGLKSSEIFNAVLPQFRTIEISFDEFREVGKWLSPYDSDDPSTERVTKFTLGGSLVFDSNYTLNSDSRFSTRLSVYDFYNPNPSVSQYSRDHSIFQNAEVNGKPVYTLSSYNFTSDITCDIVEHHVSSGDSDNRFDFSCNYDPSNYNDGRSNEINFRFMNITLKIGRVSSVNEIPSSSYITTDGDWSFRDFYIITNGDSTDSGWSGSASQSGGSPSDAPGNDDESGDYLRNLVNLFNFRFANPFAPLFSLFTAGDTCASIPTIASMLHVTETTYCSWFPSSVKNVLTPVFGLSSVMLVFGFAVHWLGSSSGNLFEDSGSHSSGDFSVSRKGGKK